MDSINEIRRLLTKWYGGDTEAFEEERLREFFLGTPAGELPEDIRTAGIIFRGSRTIAQETMPHRPSATVRRLKRRITAFAISSVAAAAVILAAVLGTGSNIYGYDSEGNPITDPHEALAMTDCFGQLSKLQTTMDIADMFLSVPDDVTD